MQSSVARLLFSFRGRIARSTWWWASAVTALAFVILFVFLEDVAGRAATWILYPPLLWILAALAVKRLRDRAQSPLWLAILVVPVLGALWMFVKLGIARGTPGENQYGPDPLDRDAEYFVVK